MDRLQGTPTPLGADPPHGLGQRDQNDQCPEEGPRQRLQGNESTGLRSTVTTQPSPHTKLPLRLGGYISISRNCCFPPTARVARLFTLFIRRLIISSGIVRGHLPLVGLL